jgi:Holliday junction resolvase-like predicted endonuclease
LARLPDLSARVPGFWPGSHDGVHPPAQQRRICNAARKFIARHHISPDLEYRFDLIRISPFTSRESLPLQHLHDAWWCDPA